MMTAKELGRARVTTNYYIQALQIVSDGRGNDGRDGNVSIIPTQIEASVHFALLIRSN